MWWYSAAGYHDPTLALVMLFQRKKERVDHANSVDDEKLPALVNFVGVDTHDRYCFRVYVVLATDAVDVIRAAFD